MELTVGTTVILRSVSGSTGTGHGIVRRPVRIVAVQFDLIRTSVVTGVKVENTTGGVEVYPGVFDYGKPFVVAPTRLEPVA